MSKTATTTTPYKEVEFKQFIKMLEDSAVPHLIEIAEILGVSQETMTAWNKSPEAHEAKMKGINKALKEMERAGKDDWKMWREKLNMLGYTQTQRHEHTGKDGKDLTVQMVSYADTDTT